MKLKIAIVGIGYVGLPLLLATAKYYKVFGYDSNKNRINQLKKFKDINNEFTSDKIKKKISNIIFTNNLLDIKSCEIYIITVPTPIYKNKEPNLSFIKKASYSIAKVLSKNNYVIYESTVYPGLTEILSKNILEKKSNLKLNKDFFVGYSPERINPGDKKHTIENITKIVSGSTIKATNFIEQIYKKILNTNIYKVSKIKTAEAAKVIENTQRDLNIAFVNELSMIFNHLNLNTNEVLKAASTKWNFLNFKPGLVGGHCIGIDPYYLTHISSKKGYKTSFISSGRKINDGMPKFIFQKLKKYLGIKKISEKNFKILIMGITFKENCSDTRNSLVFNLIDIFRKNNLKFDLYDPLASKIKKNILIKRKDLIKRSYDLILFAVSHKIFLNEKNTFYKKILKKDGIIFDLKSALPKKLIDLSL